MIRMRFRTKSLNPKGMATSIFLSGGTGYIGSQLAIRLAQAGREVHVLVPKGEWDRLPKHPLILGFEGDIREPESIAPAMNGCGQAYHLAALLDMWASDPKRFYDINVRGAENVVQAAAKAGVKRLLVCGSAGQFGPSSTQSVDESSAPAFPATDLYGNSKSEAVSRLRKSLPASLECVFVFPTRVYGPGIESKGNSITRMLRMYLQGRFRFIPDNGHRMGNYAFVKDVVEGMVLAMAHGRSGESYILGGENHSYFELFEAVRTASGKRYRLFEIPAWLIEWVARICKFLAVVFRIRPLITPYYAKKFALDWKVSTHKAVRELGYKVTPLREGIHETVRFLLAENYEIHPKHAVQ
jgi:farnesol dehydrogenase